MNNAEIKTRIDQNNALIERFLSPSTFTLNNVVADLLAENKQLQDQCKHEFDGGFCIYCYKSEDDDAGGDDD